MWIMTLDRLTFGQAWTRQSGGPIEGQTRAYFVQLIARRN